MLVQTTRSIEKTTRTARQMAEVQRDSYQALADNLAAAQRRTMGLAEDGLEFMRLQEESARAAREWFAGGVKLLQLQQRNAEFVQGWTGDAVEALREQTEKATKEAELKAAVLSALKTPNYDELSVAEISRRLDGLSTEQLRKVREYEKRNKNRETLIEQIDRKIRAKNS